MRVAAVVDLVVPAAVPVAASVVVVAEVHLVEAVVDLVAEVHLVEEVADLVGEVVRLEVLVADHLAEEEVLVVDLVQVHLGEEGAALLHPGGDQQEVSLLARLILSDLVDSI